MLQCCISFRREISRMAVLGTPSSSCSSLIFFRAMVSLVRRSRALYTTPYVPSPIFSTFSYCQPNAATTKQSQTNISRHVTGIISQSYLLHSIQASPPRSVLCTNIRVRVNESRYAKPHKSSCNLKKIPVESKCTTS